MSLAPVSQISTPYESYPGYFLKAYIEGTTTPVAMAIDASGVTTVAKAQISSGGTVPIGFIKTAGDAIFTPYISVAYDLWLFPTAAEADANDTSNAIQVENNQSFLIDIANNVNTLLNFSTVAVMDATATLIVGNIIDTNGYLLSGDGGSNRYEIVAASTGTDDGGSFIDLSASALQGKAIFPNGTINTKQFGAVGDGAADDRTVLFNALAYTALSTTTDELIINSGVHLVSSDLTVPQGVSVRLRNSAQIRVATGVTITWLGNISAGLYKIFDLVGTGTVDFTGNNGQINSVYPEWWGAIADNSTESGAAIQSSLVAAMTGKTTCRWQSGGYALSTPLTMDDRITVLGQNKEDTFLNWTGGASIVLHMQDNVVGAQDTEECLFERFSIRNTGSATVFFQIDASYTTLKEVRLYVGGSDTPPSIAAGRTLTTNNTNQLTLLNCEVRGDNVNGNGPLGFWVVRGSNLKISGGYYGVFDIALKLGNGQDVVSNAHIGDGIVMEQVTPYSSATAVCLEVESAETLAIDTVRFEYGAGTPVATLQRGIKATGKWRGGYVRNCTFSGTGVADAAIEFIAAAEDADAVTIENNLWQSVGSVTTWPILLTNAAVPNLTIGMNYHSGTAGQDDIDERFPIDGVTPNVGPGNFFRTINTGVTITDFVGVQIEQYKEITVLFGDSNTQVNFTTGNLKGNDGANWSPNTMDTMTCYHHQGIWYCRTSPNTV